MLPPAAAFWSQTARVLLESGPLAECARGSRLDFSAVRVIVPNFAHAQQLKSALAAQLGSAFIPPRITTLQAWLDMLVPDGDAVRMSASQRLMALYAELRQHAWLKKLFSARRNTDLMPLAQTLVALFDELTRTLLPSLALAPDAARERWQAALEHLPAPARNVLSDEAELVWSLWKSQLDSSDGTAARFARMMLLATCADSALVWISASEPDPMEAAFLAEYAERRPVLPVWPDWRPKAVDPAFAAAWPETLAEQGQDAGVPGEGGRIATPAGLSLCPAGGLEEEAVRGAQTVISWLEAGRSGIAIVAQDRVVARRIRALLERAQVFVSDETGWKLSTTRTAAAIAAFFDVVATRGETIALLDLLKSPFVFSDVADKPERVMRIENALRRANVLGGWDAALAVLSGDAPGRELVQRIVDQARHFTGRKTLPEWIEASRNALGALGMHRALACDAVGAQVIAMLDVLEQDCAPSAHIFSFSEWRAFVSLQLESSPFVPPDFDRRVVMLQLNGARLRSFDSVLMVGADADHLPSQHSETLFFANAVRRELGLATREMRHCLQLRDFAGLLMSNRETVLSWQTCRAGEPNTISPWIERLQLTLERAGAKPIPMHHVDIPPRRLIPTPTKGPAPPAPDLLPERLSASGYNSLVACPYQFFATRMLGLAALDELSDMPEKRDYGDWLHRILTEYHTAIRDRKIAVQDREALMAGISEVVFSEAIARSAAALGYYARWQKVMPAYVAWASERESQGWHFVAGEQWFEKPVTWTGGRVTLHGRIDRIDRNGDDEWAVLDYKTKNVPALRDKLKEREDHQLAFYGMLADVPVAYAHYVALEAVNDKTGDVQAQDYEEWQRALQSQLVASMRSIAQGAPLPASGVEQVCRFCEVRGLCRKGAWW